MKYQLYFIFLFIGTPMINGQSFDCTISQDTVYYLSDDELLPGIRSSLMDGNGQFLFYLYNGYLDTAYPGFSMNYKDVYCYEEGGQIWVELLIKQGLHIPHNITFRKTYQGDIDGFYDRSRHHHYIDTLTIGFPYPFVSNFKIVCPDVFSFNYYYHELDSIDTLPNGEIHHSYGDSIYIDRYYYRSNDQGTFDKFTENPCEE